MGLHEELTTEVKKTFAERWSVRKGTVVPESAGLTLRSEGVDLDATVLYADLAESTNLVDTHFPQFAAEIYKTYLYCAARIIRSEGGEITAYDGDRVMAVYLGGAKNTAAARTALKINYAVSYIINPALAAAYPKTQYRIKQVVGVDTSTLLAARTGVRGDNDLVWVGTAANHAAKLTGLAPTHPSNISDAVYNKMHNDAKFSSNGQAMWQRSTWNGKIIYRSNWWWRV
jgi:class 3 adenylate cyclase